MILASVDESCTVTARRGRTHPAVALPPPASKVCATCRDEKPRHAYRRHMGSHDGLRKHCRECTETGRHKPVSEGLAARRRRKVRESQSAWQQTHRRALKKASTRYPHKQAAVRAVSAAVKSGRLVRGTTCSAKGCRSGKHIEGHHWSYEPEHWLDVAWVCAKHHRCGHSSGFIEMKRGVAAHYGTIPEDR